MKVFDATIKDYLEEIDGAPLRKAACERLWQRLERIGGLAGLTHVKRLTSPESLPRRAHEPLALRPRLGVRRLHEHLHERCPATRTVPVVERRARG